MVPESAQALGYLCFIMPEDMSRSLTQEDRFCLLLSRGQLTSDERARAREFLSGTVEWSLLLDRAYAHQVSPLVYRNLRQLGFSAVPHEVQTELKGAYLANALRNQLFSDELACLLHLLSDAGVSAIPLKGVTLTFDTEAVKDPNLLLLVVFIRLKREACKLGGTGGSERRSAQRESDHFLTKRRRSDSVFTFARFAAVIKHNVERILIAKHVLKADHGC